MAAVPERVALVVDDSRLDHLATRGLLLGSSAGVTRVDWLQTWPGATAALEHGGYDLYFVDMHLGPDSGLDVIRELRLAGVLEPIIAMTGQADESIDRACTEAGASDFLVKGHVDQAMMERSIRYTQRQAAVHRELERLNAALERRATAENEQARLMRFAIEQSSDGIFITKVGPTLSEHVIVYVNAALCAALGKRAGELLGGDLPQLFRSREARPDGALERMVLAHGAFGGVVELAGASQAVRLALRATPLRPADEPVTHYVWTCRDASQPAGEELGARRRERFETIGRIATGVAHDLNERLTTVIGNLDLLSRTPADDASARAVVAASRAAEDLATQAARLVALSNRPDVAQARVVGLSTMLPSLTPLLQHAVGRLVRLQPPSIAPDLWPVHADPGRLELALLMLAAWMRAIVGDGAALQLVVANRSDDPSVPERGRDDRVTIAIAVVDGPADAASRDDDDEQRAGLARIDNLVREAHGTLTLERRPGLAPTPTIALPRAG